MYIKKKFNLELKIGVVIPCFKVKDHILKVIDLIPLFIDHIYIIDDCCPQGSGKHVHLNLQDNGKIKIIYHSINLGVGGAVKTGYKEALNDDCDVVVKIDGDGQMDPRLILNFIKPIIYGAADYSKGNRFYNLESLVLMPKLRLFGNSCLSFITKLSSGYFNIFDPTNGYTAVSSHTLKLLKLDKISNRYFFESDMLFRLNIARAVVVDIPINSFYGDEVSSLKIHKVLPEFIKKHLINFFKRILYNYYLRDVCIASLKLPISLLLLFFSIFYSLYNWNLSFSTGSLTLNSSLLVISLFYLTGLHLFLSVVEYDINSTPKTPLTQFNLD